MKQLNLNDCALRNLDNLGHVISHLIALMDNHDFWSRFDTLSVFQELADNGCFSKDKLKQAVQFLEQDSHQALPESASEQESLEILYLAYLICEKAYVFLDGLHKQPPLDQVATSNPELTEICRSIWNSTMNCAMPFYRQTSSLLLDPSLRHLAIQQRRNQWEESINPRKPQHGQE